MSPIQRVPLPGSEPTPLPGITVIGPSDPDEVATVSVVLRPRTPGSPFTHRELSLDEKKARYGADPAHVDAVVEFAAEHGLEVVDARPETRTVRLRGTLAALGAAFGVGFERHRGPAGEHRAQVGPVMMPATFAGQVVGVLGTDQRPAVVGKSTKCGEGGTPVALDYTKMTDLASLFDLPDNEGAGQYIAIIALSGGYTEARATTFFSNAGLPVPNISWKSVNGGTNDAAAGGEPELDIMMTGIVAPQATIVVYFAAGASGMYDAVIEAVLDGATVISLSYGGNEQKEPPGLCACMDLALEVAAWFGVTFCAASMDCGAMFVAYPAVSPWALACGGTQIPKSTGELSVWNNEANGWMGSGGGVSQLYPVPGYQVAAGIQPVSVYTNNPGRGIPDVAAMAQGITPPSGGDAVGTSASAPFWAALVARLNNALGYNVGWLHPTLYGFGQTSAAFTDITAGNNTPPGGQGYSAAVGWDACTGLGTPLGNAMLQLIQNEFKTQIAPALEAAEA